MTLEDIDALSRLIFHVARNEGQQGKEAIASVVMNRATAAYKYKKENGVNHPIFGDGTICGACSMNPVGDLIRMESLERLLKLNEFAKSMLAALSLSSPHYDDTCGSTNFCKEDETPPWARHKTPVCRIGRIKFYNNIGSP